MRIHYYFLKDEGRVIAMERLLPGMKIGEARLVNLGLSKDTDGFKVKVREVMYLGEHCFRDVEDFVQHNSRVVEELLRRVHNE